MIVRRRRRRHPRVAENVTVVDATQNRGSPQRPTLATTLTRTMTMRVRGVGVGVVILVVVVTVRVVLVEAV